MNKIEKQEIQSVSSEVPKATNKVDASMNNWLNFTIKCRNGILQTIGEDLREIVACTPDRYMRLDSRGLPAPMAVQTTLSNFIEKPQKYLGRVKHKKVCITFVPKQHRVIRPPSLLDLPIDEPYTIANRVASQMSARQYNAYDIVVVEMFNNDYSGNMFIYDDNEKTGKFLIEMAPGNHQQVVRGSVRSPSLLHINRGMQIRDHHPNVINNMAGDLFHEGMEVYKTAMNASLKSNTSPVGYYEFILTSDLSESDDLSVVFLDYQNNRLWKKSNSHQLMI